MGDKQALAFERVVSRLEELRKALEPDERAALNAIVIGDEAAEVTPHAAAVDYDPALRAMRVAAGDDGAYKVMRVASGDEGSFKAV